MLNRELTVIYYSDGHEDPSFEWKIRRTMLDTIEDLPLISVTHQPTNLGWNICVGPQHRCAHNMWRQFQIGAMAATTKFVCPHEADFLRPREFYEFQPEREDVFYIGNPLYVAFTGGRRSRNFYLKRGAENSMIIGREFIIDCIERMLSGRGQWQQPEDPDLVAVLYKYGRREDFQLPVPLITFKTLHGMHQSTPMGSHGSPEPLPRWGTPTALLEKYCEDTTVSG